LHWKIPGNTGDRILIQLDTPAFVRLLDPLNFEYYKRGSKYEATGGWADRLDVEFTVPYKGTFHVAVDLGGKAGTVKATCDVSRG